MIVDHPLISRQIFYPRPSDVESTLAVDVPGARLACFYHHRYANAGVLLHFHGNGEMAADYAEGYAEFFLRMGANVCFAEYRGYGGSTGVPALGAMLGDGERIVQALGVPPERVVAFGRSLGCVYAMELARRLPRLAGLILESGMADLLDDLTPPVDEADQLGCTAEELLAEIRTHFDFRAALEVYHGKLLVLHADQDAWIPRSHAERLHAWGGGSDKKLVIFPDGDHNTILFANVIEYVAEVTGFLRRAGIAVDPAAPMGPHS